mgnify:CR=1 FL=1
MNNEYNEIIKKTLVIVINIVPTTYPNRLELIINKKISAKNYVTLCQKKSICGKSDKKLFAS